MATDATPPAWLVRVLVQAEEYYWSLYRTKDDFRALANGDWKEALATFLRGYAFERAGAPRYYATASADAVKAYEPATPEPDFEQVVWHSFKSLLKDRLPNRKVSPLAPSSGNTQSLASLVWSLQPTDYNLIRWVRDGLQSNRAGEVFAALLTVRGLGVKIVPFFLRDVADAFEMDERALHIEEYLQPIDRWTRRGAHALAIHLHVPAPRDGHDDEAAHIIIQAGRGAGYPSSIFNTGLWVIGALFAPDEATFAEALASPAELIAMLSRAKQTHESRLGFINQLLGL